MNEGVLIDHLTISMPAPFDKNEQDMGVTATKQCKQNLTTYRAWFKKDWLGCYALLFLCMYNNLLGEFEHCPMTKGM